MLTRVAVVSVAAAAAMAAPAMAYVPLLSADLVRQASSAGRAAALAHHGLPAGAYVAYHTRDALAVSAGEGSIDTIVVGTPYERVLFLSYVDAFQGTTATPDEMRSAQADDTIDVIVFAHSRDPVDQSFLRRFKDATFAVAGATLHPLKTSVIGPSKDFFSTPDGRELLWLGATSFRFGIARSDAQSPARFSVTDPYGRKDLVRLDLRSYR